MKFLIAASLVCLALIGQTQGGSLRGYSYSVPVPHQIYGVPLINNEILTDEFKPILQDLNTVSVQQPIVPQSAPIVVPEIQNIPLVDSLPLVDSAVSFGIPTEPQPSPVTPAVVVSTTPQPKLPYLQPGLPVLPERPVVPLVVEEPVTEVKNAYLPPVGTPSEVYGPPAVPEAEAHVTPIAPVTEAAQPSDVYGPPTVASKAPEVPALPLISEIPALPAAPVTPSAPLAPQPSETYGPPAIPSEVYGAPPAAQVYEVPALPVTPSAPVTVVPEPSAVYGPPTVAYEAPAVPQIAEIPALPAAPVTPHVPVTATPTPSTVYGPPAVADEVPKIIDLPTLPAAPVVPSSPVEKATPILQVNLPEISLPASGFSIRPIVSQIINFASSILPISSGSYEESAPLEVPGVISGPAGVSTKSGYHYEKPVKGFPTPLQSNAIPEIGAAVVPVQVLVQAPVQAPLQVPVQAPVQAPIQAPIQAPLQVPVQVQEVVVAPAEAPIKPGYHYQKPVKGFPTPVSVGLVSHVQNSASSLSSSSIHVNQVVVPTVSHPDSVVIEQVKPSGPGFTIQSVSGNAEQTSTGNFNQISFVNHALPSIVGGGYPHSVFPVPSF